MNIGLVSPITVVAHDAGAANLIIGWLKDSPEFEIKLCIAGPAKKIFASQYQRLKNLTLKEALNNASSLLSGTSGVSDLEHNARLQAREQGIPSIGVVDHWINYRMRFLRNGHQVLPDVIWVSDDYAYSRAVKRFPKNIVRQMPNRYLEKMVVYINEITEKDRIDDIIRVLYVLEPINIRWNDSDVLGEFQALDYFIQNLNVIGNKKVMIKLRGHPSDVSGKYNDWCNRNKHLNIIVDMDNDLQDLIVWADWVVGCETFAMVIALHAKRKILSTLPPWAPACKLPHKEIVQLRELKNEIL